MLPKDDAWNRFMEMEPSGVGMKRSLPGIEFRSVHCSYRPRMREVVGFFCMCVGFCWHTLGYGWISFLLVAHEQLILRGGLDVPHHQLLCNKQGHVPSRGHNGVLLAIIPNALLLCFTTCNLQENRPIAHLAPTIKKQFPINIQQ